MRRIYLSVIQQHFRYNNQMLFLVGPRQVGKTTIAQQAREFYKESKYFNWDVVKDRTQILKGQHFIEEVYPLNEIREAKPLIIFDEIHKYKDWKNWLKGFFDLYNNYFHILVTGSTRLDIYKSGSDSLMGRYFLCRVHPLSVREILDTSISNNYFKETAKIKPEDFAKLYEFGGFPQPFISNSQNFSRRWHALRNKQLFYEDIKDLAKVHEVGQIEVLAELLQYQVGQLLNRTSLAKKIQVTTPTVSRWIETLERFYYCFSIKPWCKNISRSLIKEPKIYLWDWSNIENPGMRFENFVACHLLKAVHLWEDLGIGKHDVYFLRNKDQKEVDFLITKDNKPWILVEAKLSNENLSKSLTFFHKESNAEYAFQVINEAAYKNISCFDKPGVWIVPAQTFLSQLA